MSSTIKSGRIPSLARFFCASSLVIGPTPCDDAKIPVSVMLTSGYYKGDPVAVHRRVAGIEMELFDRWLGLFHETSRELFVDDLADAFLEKAARIAESLKLALFYRPDRHWSGKAS